MSQIVVPTLGESVSEATVAKWLKKEGDAVKMDEPLVELETDKVTLEVNGNGSGHGHQNHGASGRYCRRWRRFRRDYSWRGRDRATSRNTAC